MMLDENVLLRQERDFPRELCLVLTKIKGYLCHRHHEGLCIMLLSMCDELLIQQTLILSTWNSVSSIFAIYANGELTNTWLM